MNEERPKAITSRQLIRTLEDASGKSEGMKFCFLIGAGASISSGIPTGADLAREWIREIEEDCSKGDFARWKNMVGISEDNVGEFYPQIYEKRFGHAPETGYDYIRGLMEGREPSLGYLILANIMVREKHNVVITTNFDNLLEDAIRTYTPQKPFVAGHEALADYVPKRSDRPIILKVHRDLFLQPFSDQLNTNNLQAAWESVLGKFLSDYHLIVLGYGGNDGSLMNYLLKLENKDPIYWCVRNADKDTSKSPWDALSSMAKGLLKNKDYLVPIDGFDEFMYDCYAALGYNFLDEIETIKRPNPTHELLEATYRRLENINAQRKEISEIKRSLSQETSASYRNVLSGSLGYLFDANQETDIDKKDKIYREGIAKYPQDADLLGDYALFLKNIRHDYDQAEEYYKRALEAESKEANTLGNYAVFLTDIRHNYDQAEVYFKRALEVEPNHANTLGNYALFLHAIRHDYDQAEAYYKRTLEADPKNAKKLGNYAHFLITCRGDLKRADSLIRQAFENTAENERTKPLLAELWFYRYAHYYEEWGAEAEKELAALLNAGAKSIGWNLAPDIELARKNRHPHIEQLEAFAKKLTEKV